MTSSSAGQHGLRLCYSPHGQLCHVPLVQDHYRPQGASTVENLPLNQFENMG